MWILVGEVPPDKMLRYFQRAYSSTTHFPAQLVVNIRSWSRTRPSSAGRPATRRHGSGPHQPGGVTGQPSRKKKKEKEKAGMQSSSFITLIRQFNQLQAIRVSIDIPYSMKLVPCSSLKFGMPTLDLLVMPVTPCCTHVGGHNSLLYICGWLTFLLAGKEWGRGGTLSKIKTSHLTMPYPDL